MNKLIVLCGCLFMMASVGCRREKQHQPFVRSVELVNPVKVGNESIKKFSGIVKEDEEISLSFKTAGQIERIYVKSGDKVKKGQIIARLDVEDYKLGVENAQVQYEQMVREVDRMKQLYEHKNISGNDYDKAVSGLKQLKVQLKNNQNKLSYTILKAPVDGIIEDIYFEPSEMVNAGTSIGTLLKVSNMAVEFDIPVNQYLRLKDVVKYECRMPFAPDRSIIMHFMSVMPKADGNQLYRVRLAFDDAKEMAIAAGMNVEIDMFFKDDNGTGQYTLPLHAVCKKGDSTYVWVMDKQHKVQKRYVELVGLSDNGDALISAGLTGSEQIVKAGVHVLQENETVKVIAPSSDTNIGGLL